MECLSDPKSYSTMMKQKILYISLVVFLTSYPLFHYSLIYSPQDVEQPELFFGVDVAYGDIDDVKEVINEVSSYTNLFIIGCTGISHNTTKLDEVCQYIYDKGLHFVIFMERPPRAQWLMDSKERWGSHLLGFYTFDEAGGYQLDLHRYRPVIEAEDVPDAANQFVGALNRSLNWITIGFTELTDFPLFTSDYGLYWFDYKGGYDVVLSQLGWNYSRQLNIALVRGAATIQKKEWGAIITWTYNNPPYIESGKDLYEDLVLAYENGAKYIVIFDSNEDYSGGILENEHLEAMKQFWQYIEDYPRKEEPIGERVAYVLPKDYAYGFRGPKDKIWGLWEAESILEFSEKLCTELSRLMVIYEKRLDIIYDDNLELDGIYSKYIFWNGTIFEP